MSKKEEWQEAGTQPQLNLLMAYVPLKKKSSKSHHDKLLRKIGR